MRFRYRFVPFGTNFVACGGTRGTSSLPPEELFENELALDVGGACWDDGEPRHVIDHHFTDSQFPSASAAVLHLATRIRTALTPYDGHPDGIWLVTHHQPDFDAFCSVYLARQILLASSPTEEDLSAVGVAPDTGRDVSAPPEGVTPGTRKINWFSPSLTNADAESRWMLLLAAYASVVDQGRRLHCPRTRALHSVLYAALARGRSYLGENDGATEFFDAVRLSLRECGLHPLFDNVLGENLEFAPELALLDREEAAYRRDVARARKSVVSVPVLENPRDNDLLTELMQTPLLDGQLELRSEHRLRSARVAQADAIWLRDPECLLFKEWARQDNDAATLGQGFVFTAIAYSKERAGAQPNESNYFFAIDPEKSHGRYLYPVWAALQAAEVRALERNTDLKDSLEAALKKARADKGRSTCRPLFVGRAGRLLALFDDPWFDGQNYRWTIVATPNRGTAIGRAGRMPDLSDDPVARIVREELEDGVFLSPPKCEDIGAGNSDQRLRFVHVGMRDGVAVTRGSFANQTGRRLWEELEPDSGGSVPSDFESRHLLVDEHAVVVWSRRGLGIAYDKMAKDRVEELRRQLETMTELSRGVQRLVPGPSDDIHVELADGERLLRKLIELKRQFALPDGRPLRRLFDALSLAEPLDGVRDLVHRRKVDRQTESIKENIGTVAAVQLKVEWIEILIVSFYVAHLTHTLAHTLWEKEPVRIVILTVLCSLGAGLVALLALQPWKHVPEGHGKEGSFLWRMWAPPVAILLLLIVWLVLALNYKKPAGEPAPGDQASGRYHSGAGPDAASMAGMNVRSSSATSAARFSTICFHRSGPPMAY